MTKDTAMQLTRFASALVALALLASACSGSDEQLAEPTTGTSPTSEATAEPTTQVEPAAAEEPTPTTESTVELDPSTTTDLWHAMWDGIELVVTDPDQAQEAVGSVATAAVFDQLNAIYNPNVESDVGNSPRTFVNNPVLTEEDDGTVTINDCMFESPKIGNATIWYSGTIKTIDGQWRITSVTLESEIGCVPSALAASAIEGYENYWDARVEFWDPANPEHELVEATLTGIELDFVHGLLVDHQQQGWVLRGRAETHPEIIEVRSSTEAVILDCSIEDLGRGLFDGDTGERLPGIDEVVDGQRDLGSAVMTLEDGVWKVSDVQARAGVSCDIAPTTQGLPTV